ncbi:MAG: 6-bladed beta-propeller [Bacillota bacterium]
MIKFLLKGTLSRNLVIAVQAIILGVGAITFTTLYLVGKPPQSVFVPRSGLLGDRVPEAITMINGPFGEDQLKKPMDVTVSDKRVYISDTGNHRVEVFDQDGNYLFKFGKRGKDQGQFEFPYGIAQDATGNVYVADLYNGKISVFDSEGKFLHYFPESAQGRKALDGPGDLLITQDKLYVTDINQNKVFAFELASGKLLKTYGKTGYGPGELKAPNGVAVDGDGNVWVVDTVNQRVQVFSPDGNVLQIFNGSNDPKGDSVFVNPRGIGILGNKVFVVSNLTNNVWAFDLNGETKFSFGEQGNLTNQFMLPNGLFVAGDGRIYIADSANNRVTVYR